MGGEWRQEPFFGRPLFRFGFNSFVLLALPGFLAGEFLVSSGRLNLLPNSTVLLHAHPNPLISQG